LARAKNYAEVGPLAKAQKKFLEMMANPNVDGYSQNRRQKFFSRGIYVCAGGLTLQNFAKTPLLCSAGVFLRRFRVATGLAIVKP